MRSAPVILGLTLAIALGVRAEQQPAAIPLSVELPDNPTVGARLFVSKQCVRCHALGGEQEGVGPDLGRVHIIGTVLDVAAALWNHAPAMQERMRELKIPTPRFTADELADLVAFLTAYRYYLTELGTPGSPTRGLEVFRTKSCSTCHGSPDDWNLPGPSLEQYRGISAIEMAEIMWNHGRDMAPVMRERGVAWPKFSGGEMGDLLAYLQAGSDGSIGERVYFEPGSPRRGQELFASKQCVTCHAIRGQGGDVGPDLGSRSRELLGSVSSIAGLMWNHSPAMVEEAQRRGVGTVEFSGPEMADVIAYLYFINYASVEGNPERGQSIFASRCSTCHVLGDPSRIGPDLLLSRGLDQPLAIVAAMWNHATEIAQEVRNQGGAWPRLASGETADLTAYVLQERQR